jgi:hypothetical protein
MTSLLRSLIPARASGIRAADAPLAFDDWVGMFSGGSFPMLFGNLSSREEEIATTFSSLQSAMRTNGVVFACELVRVMLFSEARFMFRQRRSGRPGDMFSTNTLRLLERPEGVPGSTTAGLLKRAMLHADYGGTGFMVRRVDRIRQPRPDWMTVVLGSHNDPDLTAVDLDAEVIGYLYHPGGRFSGSKPVALLPEQVATFVPFPDPIANVRGIPWPAAVARNIMGHNSATTHKLKFFENGATPQVIVSLDKGITDPAKFRQWVEVLDQDHKGVANAYKTLYLGAGATATPVGMNLQQLDFKDTQGADETLIAAASGVGAVVAQLSEGMQGSSLNAGNFAQAMRRVADVTMRPLWRDMAGSLEVLVPPPPDAELWYDDRDIPALKDDVKDAAEVRSKDASTIRNLSDAGFRPDDVIEAVTAGDLKRLSGKHTGLFSVQLQKPGEAKGAAPAALSAERVDVPLLASGELVEVRCTGTHKDGRSCNALLGKRVSDAPVGFETKCHQCGTLVAA